MSTSIVIPVYGRWDLCHQLLFDIYKNCSLVEEVIIVNDKPHEKDVRNGLVWWKLTNMFPIEVIETPENLGFLRASNLGLKHAVEDDIFLISTDVRVHKNIVGVFNLENKLLVGGRLLDWNTGWNEIKGTVYPYVEGWLLGAGRNQWKELGYFDERFAPYDAEDLDLSITAVSKGFELASFPEGYTSHLGAQSIPYGEEREKQTKKNIERLKQKWAK